MKFCENFHDFCQNSKNRILNFFRMANFYQNWQISEIPEFKIVNLQCFLSYIFEVSFWKFGFLTKFWIRFSIFEVFHEFCPKLSNFEDFQVQIRRFIELFELHFRGVIWKFRFWQIFQIWIFEFLQDFCPKWSDFCAF